VNDDKARQEALLKASLAEARAAEAAAKALAEAAKQAEIKAHQPQLDHIMVPNYSMH
jgi:hypothetical protein